MPVLSVREMRLTDVALIADYWLQSEPSFLRGMGVDISKLPSRKELADMLTRQYDLPVEQKDSYCIVWEIDGVASGHCNTNPVVYGEEACLHLHMWHSTERRSGMGLDFVKMTLPYFFTNLKIKRLYSEPYALNEAPNKTLLKAGFILVKEYTTVPGSLSFEQPVKRWEMSRERFDELYET